MKVILTESQYVTLIENLDRKKKLFIDLLGEDLINSIQMITSAKELPKEFLKSLGSWSIQQYIDAYGPLYYFVFEGEPFIYKDRVNPKGEEYEMFINSKGESFFNGQITNRLGLDYTGLKFSEVIDMFLNEEEDTFPLNESVDKNKKFLNNLLGQDLTDSIQKITSTKQLSKEFLKHFGASKIVQQHYIDLGPLYYFVFDGEPFIYRQRPTDTSEEFEIFTNSKGKSFYNNEIPEMLGIDVMGLRFSDIIDIFYNQEEEPLNESVDKNKKFLTKVMGQDFTNKIKKITSSYAVPMSFGEGVSPEIIRRWLNHWGPMYLVNINGKKYLYQDRGDFEMFLDEEGFDDVDGEIPEELGISDMGLKFYDIIDMFYNVEEPLNESVDKNKKFLIDVMGIDFDGKIKEIKDTYDVPMEFDELIGPDLIRRMLNYFGPMYLVDIDGKKYLYQYRSDEDNRFGWEDSSDFEWFHDENGFNYVDGEIPEQLGITQMGLKFSDIIDIFFNED